MSNESLGSRLLSIIRKRTLHAAISSSFDDTKTDALTLSIDMNYDRSNVSRNLNELFRRKLLTKVKGRPTLYFDRQTLADYYAVQDLPCLFDSIAAMQQMIGRASIHNEKTAISAFDNVLGCGAHESLFDTVRSVIKYALYPNTIYGFLLFGEVGTGKSTFRQAVIRLGKELGWLSESVQICEVDFFLMQDLPDFFTALEEEKQYHGNCLVFTNVESLTSNHRRLFCRLLTRLHEENQNGIAAYIVETPSASLADDLLQQLCYLPQYISLPTLDSRSVKEKILLLLQEFQRQCDLVKMPILLDQDSFHSFLLARYEQHLRTLVAEISFACRSGYYESYGRNKRIVVGLSDLSERIFQNAHDSQEISACLDSMETRINLCSLSFLPGTVCPAYGQLLQEPIDENGCLPDTPLEVSGISVREQCEADLQMQQTALTHGNAAIYSAIKLSLLPYLQQVLPELHRLADYHGLFVHLSETISRITTGCYTNPFTVKMIGFVVSDQIRPVAAEIASLLHQNFEVLLPALEKQYIEVYLTILLRIQSQARVKLAVLCHWDEILKVYQRFTDSLTYANRPIYFVYKNKSLGREHHQQLKRILNGITAADEGCGIAVISDGPLDREAVKMICHITNNSAIFIGTLSQEIISKALIFFDNPANTPNAFEQYLQGSRSGMPMIESRISLRIKDLLSDTLMFLDADKVYRILLSELSQLLNALSIPYSDNLAIRFIAHCAFMLERIMAGDALPYKEAVGFLAQHSTLSEEIQAALKPLEQQFNILIPPSETAYILEIFQDFV